MVTGGSSAGTTPAGTRTTIARGVHVSGSPVSSGVPPRLCRSTLGPVHASAADPADYWTPAVRAVDGRENRPPYALRHAYAAFSISCGASLFALVRSFPTRRAQIARA